MAPNHSNLVDVQLDRPLLYIPESQLDSKRGSSHTLNTHYFILLLLDMPGSTS